MVHWIRAGLLLLVLLVFGQTVGFGFIRLDDPGYVSENPRVLAGLTSDGLVWAFTTTHRSNWHPLTWLSLMLDAQIGGGGAAVFHATNVALHAANVLLLFQIFLAATSLPWRSAFVAAVFAIHPLRAESVAWVTERKDVLSGMFALLAILAYVHWTRRPGRWRWAVVAVLFGLGLLAKPMLVTLPVVLLVLDFWPLRRLRAPLGISALRLAGEKKLLFAMAALSGIATIWAQAKGGAVESLQAFPLSMRAANALVACLAYIRKAAWPSDLALPYPYDPGSLTPPRVAVAALLVAAISFWALRVGRNRPYLPAGWVWYLVTVAPVLGIVQVGTQAMADRYTYLPLIGVTFAATWWIADLALERIQPEAARRVLLGAAAALAIAAMGVASFRGARLWRNSTSLFSHALQVTGPNAVAHNILGLELYGAGRPGEAIPHFEAALRVSPVWPDAHGNLAAALARTGRLVEAASHYSEAARLRPGDPDALAGLGLTLARLGRDEEAAARFEEALKLDPANSPASKGLGFLRARQGRDAEAVVLLRQAVAVEPEDVQSRINLAASLFRIGQLQEARVQLDEALRLDPKSDAAHTNLGILLLRLGLRDEARGHLEEALRRNPDNETARRYLEGL